ncbi:radical SAM protein [bacterium]|nr:MAG: radical SAM protein [bacterium]
MHVSYFPQDALLHCDSVVIGEAEPVWQQVLDDYENKSLKKIYKGEPLEDYFSPVFDYFMRVEPSILATSGILLSRGCKYCCEFCARPFGRLRFIKLEQAVKLVEKAIRGVVKPFFWQKPGIIFRDDNIFSDPVYAKKLFKQIIPMGINWVGNSSIDIAFDEEALALAKASGCQELFIGFETIYPEKLKKTSIAGINSLYDYFKAIKKIRSYGIRIMGGFILGFDYYTHKDYLRLLWFIIRSRLYHASLTILTPFPGSLTYEKLNKEGRIITFDWSKYDSLQHVVFKPKNMPVWVLQLWFIFIRIISLLFSPLYLQILVVLFGSYIIFYYVVANLMGSF